MITFQVSYYVLKMHNLLTTETLKEAKNNYGLELNFLLMQEC